MSDEPTAAPTVFVIDDDGDLRDALDALLRSVGLGVETFPSTEAFEASGRLDAPGCLLLDIRLRGRSGLAFQLRLRDAGRRIPILFMSGHVDVPMAVQAMKNGALDVLAKPARPSDLIDAVNHALAVDAELRRGQAELDLLRRAHAGLSVREREVMARVVAGASNRETAADLGLSEATVKTHRARVMEKMGLSGLAQLVDAARRLAPD